MGRAASTASENSPCDWRTSAINSGCVAPMTGVGDGGVVGAVAGLGCRRRGASLPALSLPSRKIAGWLGRPRPGVGVQLLLLLPPRTLLWPSSSLSLSASECCTARRHTDSMLVALARWWPQRRCLTGGGRAPAGLSPIVPTPATEALLLSAAEDCGAAGVANLPQTCPAPWRIASDSESDEDERIERSAVRSAVGVWATQAAPGVASGKQVRLTRRAGR